MNNCPYCQKPLPNPVKRKSSCPFCNKTIFVRNGSMVTEFDSLKIDWIKSVGWLGIGDTEIEDSKKHLQNQFNTEPNFNDIRWNVLNRLVLKSAGNPQMSRAIYLEMAHILELEGKDNSEPIARAFKFELLEDKKNGVKFVEIFNCNDDNVCAECRKMAKKKIPIDVAVETSPIPNTCTNEYCRCWYSPVY